MKDTALVFQGGGPTAVINASLAGFLSQAKGRFDKVLGLPFSLDHITRDALIDLSILAGEKAVTERNILAATPGAILGSSRTPVDGAKIQTLANLAKSMNATAVVGIGGNGTMSVLERLCQALPEACVVGVPKTVDNDLPGTFVSPGYGSAARHTAISMRDLSYDAAAMSGFDDVSILETMGRDTGWLSVAAGALVASGQTCPDFILCPERPIDVDHLLDAIAERKREKQWVLVAVNEMLRDTNGNIVGDQAENWPKDGLGRTMYSLSVGVGSYLAGLLQERFGFQTRTLRPNILGRCDTRAVSPTDRDLAWRCGAHACAIIGHQNISGVMVAVNEDLTLGTTPLEKTSGCRAVPQEFFVGAYGISEEARGYVKALIGPVDPVLPAILSKPLQG